MSIPSRILAMDKGMDEWCILHGYRGSIAHGMYEPTTEPNSIDDKDTMGVCVPPIDYSVTAYDAASGRQLWRFYTVPGDPARGFENVAMAMAAKTWGGHWWKQGGNGSVWDSITYDPAFNRVYIGTANGTPADATVPSM